MMTKDFKDLLQASTQTRLSTSSLGPTPSVFTRSRAQQKILTYSSVQTKKMLKRSFAPWRSLVHHCKI